MKGLVRQRWIRLAVALFAAVLCTASARPQTRAAKPSASLVGGYVTARAELSQITKTAQAWQSDAVLCWITTTIADEQGKAQGFAGWDFRFCSKSANQQYAVSHMPAGFSGKVVGKADRKAAPADFIDSDQAMAAAKRAGFKPQMTCMMTLDPSADGNGFVWTIYGPNGISDTTKQFLVDAKTGKLVRAGN